MSSERQQQLVDWQDRNIVSQGDLGRDVLPMMHLVVVPSDGNSHTMRFQPDSIRPVYEGN